MVELGFSLGERWPSSEGEGAPIYYLSKFLYERQKMLVPMGRIAPLDAPIC